MSEFEWITCKERIDPSLRTPPALDHHAVLGWDGHLEALLSCDGGIPTASGPADYAIFGDGRLLGIIEAKKVSVGPQNVLEQGKHFQGG